MSKFYLGQTVYHKDVYNFKEPLKVIGIRVTELELEGDYSGGTGCAVGAVWLPISGVAYKNQWGAMQYPNDDFFERITKNAGQRDV